MNFITSIILIQAAIPCMLSAMHIKDLSTNIEFLEETKTLHEWLYGDNSTKKHLFDGTLVINATDMPKFHKMGIIGRLMYQKKEILDLIDHGNFIYFDRVAIKNNIAHGALVTHKDYPHSVSLIEIKACYLEHQLKKGLVQKLHILDRVWYTTNPILCAPQAIIPFNQKVKGFSEWIQNDRNKLFGETEVFCPIETTPYFKEIGTLKTLTDQELSDLNAGAYYFPNINKKFGAFLLAPKKRLWTCTRLFQEYYFIKLLDEDNTEAIERIDFFDYQDYPLAQILDEHNAKKS